MFGGKSIMSIFSISKMINGLSRTLNTVNELIPLYKNTKPAIENAKNVFGKVKEFANTNSNKIINKAQENIKPIKKKVNTIKSTNFESINEPVFFK